MVQQYVIYFCIRFAVRQLAKYGRETKWDTVKKDWDARIADLVPGKMLDDEAVALTNAILDGAATICQDSGDVAALLGKTAGQDWSGAADLLGELLKKTVGGKVAAALAA